ncbi:MAG: porin family protein [Gammaproteobacteria bacterium]|nr:porin family protein [Gammaproteobacteria bacterium]
MKKTTLTKLSGIVAGSFLSIMAFSPQAMAADENVEALQLKIQKMEDMLNSLQSELQNVRQESRESIKKVQVVEERVAVVNRVPKHSDSVIFFRGGFARMNVGRGNQVFTDLFQGGSSINNGTQVFSGLDDNDAKGGFYAGAGIEHALTRDLWGMSDFVAVFGEIMFEWRKFDSQKSIAVVPAAAANLGGGLNVNPDGRNIANRITLSQFTLTASPKIKFNPNGNFHPWIIPAGFAFHVISPPSDSGTVLTAGVQFGAGAEYEVGSLVLGIDARYHLTGDQLDGVDADGLTAGGYVGFKF